MKPSQKPALSKAHSAASNGPAVRKRNASNPPAVSKRREPNTPSPEGRRAERALKEAVAKQGKAK